MTLVLGCGVKRHHVFWTIHAVSTLSIATGIRLLHFKWGWDFHLYSLTPACSLQSVWRSNGRVPLAAPWAGLKISNMTRAVSCCQSKVMRRESDYGEPFRWCIRWSVAFWVECSGLFCSLLSSWEMTSAWTKRWVEEIERKGQVLWTYCQDVPGEEQWLFQCHSEFPNRSGGCGAVHTEWIVKQGDGFGCSISVLANLRFTCWVAM